MLKIQKYAFDHYLFLFSFFHLFSCFTFFLLFILSSIFVLCFFFYRKSYPNRNQTIPKLNKNIVYYRITARLSNYINTSYQLNSIEGVTYCRTIPGLTRSQLKLCHQQPDAMAVALEGLEIAMNECQYQFQGHRWNCSSSTANKRNPITNALLKRGKLILL